MFMRLIVLSVLKTICIALITHGAAYSHASGRLQGDSYSCIYPLSKFAAFCKKPEPLMKQQSHYVGLRSIIGRNKRKAYERFTSSVASFDESTTSLHSFDSLGDVIRKEFPILQQKVYGKDWIYFDNAATTQKPNAVIQKWNDYMKNYNSNIHRATHHKSMVATEEYETARQLVSEFINAKHQTEIVFTSGATNAINLVASTWGVTNVHEGDEIVVSIAEHHSNMVPWQNLAKEKKATLRFVKLNERGCVDMSHFKSLLSDKTKLVCIFHASNVLGCTTLIKEITAAAHRVGAKVLVDACQSAPHQKLDVQSIECDFLVASGHKMCGPTAIGFLYGKSKLLEETPPWSFGGEMIQEVTTKGSTYADPPYKFEAGTPPIAEAIALGAAIRFLNDVKLSDIQKYESFLASYLYEAVSSLPELKIYGPDTNRTNLVSFNHYKFHAQDVAAFLDYEGVAIRAGHQCAQPLHREALQVSGSARASLYFYNTVDEIDRFVEKLKNVIKLLKSLQNG